MRAQNPKRVRDALAEGTRLLARAGVETPRRDAELLLSHALGRPRTWLFAHPDEVLPLAAWERYREALERRARGEPPAYILGEWEFYGVSLTVTPDVLVPRPETELLVDLALDYLQPPTRSGRVADVGTGSGAIALAVALRRPRVHVWATDISARALRVARHNVRRHRVSDSVHLVQADVLTPLIGPFDLILANLPYVALEEAHVVDSRVKAFEPPEAIWGGPHGTVYIERLLRQVPGRLAPGGVALLEIGYRQAQRVLHLAESLVPRFPARVHPDPAGHPRVVELRRPNG